MQDNGKIRLTVLKNPFDRRDRVEYWLDYTPGKCIGDYLADKSFIVADGIELAHSVSGKILTSEEISHICPRPGDHVVVAPVLAGGGGGEGGKNTGAMIAMIVVMIVAIAVSYGALAPVFGSAFAAGGMGAMVASAAIMIGGSLLINAMFPTSSPDVPQVGGGPSGITVGGGAASFSQTDTYGWGEMSNNMSPGLPIPRVYGTRRLGGTIINRYIDVNENEQYYNALIALAGCNIQGVANVKINGQVLTSYPGVWMQITLGTRDQLPIGYFTDVYNHQTYNSEISKTDYTTKTTTGASVEGLRIEVMCPYGLYYTNVQGGLDQTFVELSIEYKKDGDLVWTAIQAGAVGGNTVYTDYVWTSQGFRFANDCETVSFTLLQTGLQGHYHAGVLQVPIVVVQYRTGTGFASQEDGWVDYGTYSTPTVTVGEWVPIVDEFGVWTDVWREHQADGVFIPVNISITGFGRVPVEVRIKQGENGYIDANSYFANPVRSVNLGGTTGNVNIVAAQSKPVRRVYEVRDLPIGRYSVRVKKLAEGGTSTRYSTSVYLAAVSEIIYDDFAYPYCALLGIRALATSQLSGQLPAITAEVIRSHTVVYNTTTLQWEVKRADNPAWACYDILVRPRYKLDFGINEELISKTVEGYDGVNPDRMDFVSFGTWADWCDVSTPEGDRRCTVNIVFDSQMSVWDALIQISQVGRGMVVMRGTKFSCVIDKSADPVQLFTVGNIIEDTFKESFLGLDERANIVECTYFEAGRDYQRETITVYGNDWVECGQERRSQMTLYGCTSYNQAFREAIYRLNINKYLTRTVSFDVDIDAIACQVGDVIRVQHDIPQWGYGGRVVDSTVSSITFDQVLTASPGSTYVVCVRHNDDTFETKTISGTGSSNSFNIVGTWTTNPEVHAVYTFGVENYQYKLFRVISITRSQDFRRTITAVEYNESLYTEGTPTTWNVSALNKVPRASGLLLKERLKFDSGGSIASEVSAIWSYSDPIPSRIARWEIYRKDLSVSGAVWEYLGQTKDLEFVGSSVPWDYQHEYKIAVCGVDIMSGRSDGPDSPYSLIENIVVQWKSAPPEDVSNFSVVQIGSDFSFAWDHVTDIDRRGYEIRMGSSWEGGEVIVKEISENSFIFPASLDGSYKFWIKAIDTSGNYSTNATSSTITIVGMIDLLNVILSRNEIVKFAENITNYGFFRDVSGSYFALPTSGCTFAPEFSYARNLLLLDSGTSVLVPPHTVVDNLNGISTLTDNSIFKTYQGVQNLDGEFVTEIIDLGASAFNKIRCVKDYESEVLEVTDLTFPDRTDQTYPTDRDDLVTSESILHSFVRGGGTTAALLATSWTTYTSPISGDFRYWQRREAFQLDGFNTTLIYTGVTTYMDVAEKTYVFSGNAIAKGGTTFSLATLGMTIFSDYVVSCSVVTDPYFYNIKNKSLAEFYVTLYDDAGVTKAGEVDMTIKGY